jgi:uncharacterized protein
MAQAGKKQVGGRVKHVPQRTCIACRLSGAKRGLIRLVRTPEGRVEVDPGGKRHGRGAYLCHNLACWEQAFKRQALVRALRLDQLSVDNQHDLLMYIRRLSVADEEVPQINDADVDASPHDLRG